MSTTTNTPQTERLRTLLEASFRTFLAGQDRGERLPEPPAVRRDTKARVVTHAR